MRIQGLGVIDEATLQLDPGFTVVTGETGAGKTMVVTGLHLLSGGRAEASRVRTGASRAVVEGRFHIPPDSPAAKVASDAAAEPDEDGSLIALRTVGSDGRSRAHLGGRSVPVGVLSELAEELIAVHGQNDQLRLLHPAEQRAVLDTFAGDAVAKALAEYRSTRAEWIEVIEELRQRTERARDLAKQADMLQHGVQEIEAVDPKPGEDTSLVDEARRLADVDQLREASSGAHFALSGSADEPQDGAGALSLVDEARRRLAASEDPRLRDLEPRLAEAEVLLSDVANELSTYLEALEADPARLEQVLARQAELKMLTRKYGTDIDGVLAWASDAAQTLTGLDTSEEALSELARRRDELAAELARHAVTLTDERERAAKELSEEVTAELAGLAMGQAGIEVAVRPRIAADDDANALRVGTMTLSAGPDGVDEVELRLRAHDGAQPLPVHKAASGG
ncbi:MAG: AAA family ATPase, partial [Kibdelosporangium sp.]